MRKQDILSIIITFIFGAIGGVYLFMTVYVPLAVDMGTPDDENLSELIIVGEIYGSCGRSCPSFQILSDGTYRYLYTPGAGQEQVLKQGSLPYEEQRDLKKALSIKSLKDQSKPRTFGSCSSNSGGVDVSYEITIEGDLYKLDSCQSAVAGDSKLWLTLHSFWEYFKTAGNN